MQRILPMVPPTCRWPLGGRGLGGKALRRLCVWKAWSASGPNCRSGSNASTWTASLFTSRVTSIVYAVAGRSVGRKGGTPLARPFPTPIAITSAAVVAAARCPTVAVITTTERRAAATHCRSENLGVGRGCCVTVVGASRAQSWESHRTDNGYGDRAWNR